MLSLLPERPRCPHLVSRTLFLRDKQSHGTEEDLDGFRGHHNRHLGRAFGDEGAHEDGLHAKLEGEEGHVEVARGEEVAALASC